MRATLSIGLVLLAALALYSIHWKGLADPLGPVDFADGPFFDFSGPYYETGRTLLETGQPATGFYYSPFFGLLMAALVNPLGEAAVWPWLCLQLAVIVGLAYAGQLLVRGCCAGASRAAAMAWPLSLALVLFSFPVLHNLFWGQISAPLVLLMLLALISYEKQRVGLGGFLLGAAAAIKFYPALLLCALLAQRRWRAAGFVIAWALALGCVLPAAILGATECRAFYSAVFAGMRTASASTELWAGASSSQYLPDVLGRWFHWQSGATLERVARILCAAWALWHLVLITRTRTGQRIDLRAAVALLLLTTPLAIGTAWPHYLCYLPFCQLLLAAGAWTMPAGWRRSSALALIGLSCCAGSSLLYVALGDGVRMAALGLPSMASLACLAAWYMLHIGRDPQGSSA